MRQLFPKLSLCPILKASCFNLRPARARPALKLSGEHGMTICDGLRISELVNGLLELEQIAFA